MANHFNKNSQEMDAAEHISPQKTGDNIEGKRTAGYVWDSETNEWQRSSSKITLTHETVFDEVLVGERNSIFNLKPTWGTSVFRDAESVSGTGATIGETGGELRLQTGTSTNGFAKIRTRQRGVYKPGQAGEIGIGIRIPVQPTSTAYAEWGYFDDDNGIGYGYDATGLYVFYKTGGTKTKTYQTNWNVDTMDGTGISGLTLDVSDGLVYQIEFVWYGYGSIRYFINMNKNNVKQRFEVHRTNVEGALTIVDPNQYINIEAYNGADSTTNLNVYLGGRQFSTIGGFGENQRRPVLEKLSNYTTPTNTNWLPLIAVRKKSTFGPSNRNNSVTAIFKESVVASDGEVETRVTFGGTTSNLAWATPETWAASETACEVKVTGGTALTASADGYVIEYGYVPNSTSQGSSTTTKEEEIAIGTNNELILWVRRLSGTGTIIIKHAHIKWEEIW